MVTTYQHDTLIVGGSLAALLYGYKNKIPVVYVDPRIPLFFEAYQSGTSKQQLWYKLAFQLSLDGLLPMADKATSCRAEDGGILKVFIDAPRVIAFEYKKLLVFDDSNLEGWEGEIKHSEKYRVLDWINDRKSSPHAVDFLGSDDDFVKEIYFYPSERIDGNWSGKKDILAVSYLTREQLDSVEYCDTYVRFKVLHMMKSAGIIGPKNGVSKKDPTRHKHLSVKIETSRRDVETILTPPFDEDTLLQDFELEHRYLDG